MNKEQELTIAMTKIMVNQLAAIQDGYYNALVKELGIDDSQSWLFDYVFNSDMTESFTQYLENYGMDYNTFLKDEWIPC